MLLMLGIFLLMSFVYAEITWSDGTLTEFELTSTRPVCDSGRFVWREWIVGVGLEEISSLDSCYRESGWPSRTCCPEERECVLILGPDYGKCKGNPSPLFCADYTVERYGSEELAQTYCGNFSYATANRSIVEATGINNICSGSYMESKVIDGETCYRLVLDCRCEWDNTDNGCIAKASRTNWICPNEIGTVEGSCSFKEISKQDDCDNSGYILYSWKALWEDGAEIPDWCQDNTRKYRCAIKLIFFTIASLIVTIAVIVIIYLILLKRKARKKVKRKAKKK